MITTIAALVVAVGALGLAISRRKAVETAEADLSAKDLVHSQALVERGLADLAAYKAARGRRGIRRAEAHARRDRRRAEALARHVA